MKIKGLIEIHNKIKVKKEKAYTSGNHVMKWYFTFGNFVIIWGLVYFLIQIIIYYMLGANNPQLISSFFQHLPKDVDFNSLD